MVTTANTMQFEGI